MYVLYIQLGAPMWWTARARYSFDFSGFIHGHNKIKSNERPILSVEQIIKFCKINTHSL